MTLRPREETPALDVEVWDGTESLHLVWLGRRRIAGIVPGIKIQATGRITTRRKVTTMFNPAYEIIGRVGAAAWLTPRARPAASERGRRATGCARSEADLRRYDTVEELLRDKLSEAIGGWRGAVESAVPTLAFALVWAAHRRTSAPSLIVAGACVARPPRRAPRAAPGPALHRVCRRGHRHLRLLRAPVGSGRGRLPAGHAPERRAARCCCS